MSWDVCGEMDTLMLISKEKFTSCGFTEKWFHVN